MILASVRLVPAGDKKNHYTNKDGAEGQDGRPGRLNSQRKEANAPKRTVLCSKLNKPEKGCCAAFMKEILFCLRSEETQLALRATAVRAASSLPSSYVAFL